MSTNLVNLPIYSVWYPDLQNHFPCSPFTRGGVSVKFLSELEETQYYRDLEAGKTISYNDQEIDYTLNRDGFRTVEFDQIPEGIRVVSTGCSNTEGKGLPEHHTWPHLFCERYKQIRNEPVVNLNLGVSASANRTIAIRTFHAIDLLRPDLVLVNWSFSSRVLYIMEDGWTRDWSVPSSKELSDPSSITEPRRKYYESVQNDTWDLNDWIMDIHFVNMAARLRGIRLIHLFNWANDMETQFLQNHFEGVFDRRLNIPTARDLAHPGLEYNQWLVERVFEYMEKNRNVYKSS